MGNVGIQGWTADAVTIENEGWEVVGHEHEEQDGHGTATQAASADCKHHDERRCRSVIDVRACSIM